MEEVIKLVLGDKIAKISEGITSISTAHAPTFSRVFKSSKSFFACSMVFPTALNPPVHVLFRGTRPK